MTSPLLEVKQLSVQFRLKNGKTLQALSEVNFSVAAGETLGIVGESGCGKSTLVRSILQLLRPQQGEILWQGELLTQQKAALRTLRRNVQCIFQDPLDALNPRMTVGDILQEPLRALRPELTTSMRQQRVDELLSAVGLTTQMRNRYPHEFSGGQCQRIGIARALSVEPRLILCDEPVSALDVSIQGQIVELLANLQRQHALTLLFVSHDLQVVRSLSQRVLVLYLGQVMELADTASLYSQPLHPYTQRLLTAIPLADPRQERQRLAQLSLDTGEIPSPLNPPSGCVFHPRCHQAQVICQQQRPVLKNVGARQVACHLYS